MVRVTLNNLVLKTKRVGNVMPVALADRIGSGFVAASTHPTATILSQGQFPLPRFPEPDTGFGQVVSDAMSKPPARKPRGHSESDSGAMAGRFPQVTTPRTTATGWRRVGTSWASYPGSPVCASRIGRDCQSPDRPAHATDRAAHASRRRPRMIRSARTAAI